MASIGFQILQRRTQFAFSVVELWKCATAGLPIYFPFNISILRLMVMILILQYGQRWQSELFFKFISDQNSPTIFFFAIDMEMKHWTEVLMEKIRNPKSVKNFAVYFIIAIAVLPLISFQLLF